MATIAILHQRLVSEGRLHNEQLNTALAERSGLSLPAAFEATRTYGCAHNLRLAAVAGHVIDKTPARRGFTGDLSVDF